MTYRKMHVNNIAYEYVIGKVFTKIKPSPGFGGMIVKNSDFGNPWYRGYVHNSNRPASHVVFLVSPYHVKQLLLGTQLNQIPRYQTCVHGTKTACLITHPFDAEIYSEIRPMIDCDKCYKQVADDI